MSHVLHHRVYKKKYNILRPKGGVIGPPVPPDPGSLTVFNTWQASPNYPPGEPSDPPLASRNAMLALLSVSGSETFEGFANLTGLDGLVISANGNSATLSCDLDASLNYVFDSPLDGLYNTVPFPGGSKYALFEDNNGGGSPSVQGLKFTFAAPLAAWGLYFTDQGDFNGFVTLEIHEQGGASTFYPAAYSAPGPTQGGLNFFGFVDTRPGIVYDYCALHIDAIEDLVAVDGVILATKGQCL